MRATPSLPPLPSLRAFVLAARHLNFRQAGEELLISQSAVSHHVAKLEAMLGKRLFVRKARGVELTEVGADYYRRVARAFHQIEDATRSAIDHTERRSLVVSVLPSFAATWLVPRLTRWRAHHEGKDIDVAIDPTVRAVDVDAGDADIAIRYGWGTWAGQKTRLLKQETLTIVASPEYLENAPAIVTPADVLDHTLLTNLHLYDWEAWARSAGTSLANARLLQLTDYNIVLQAALDGQGLAVGRIVMLADRLNSGALQRVFPTTFEAPGLGHWLVQSGSSDSNPDVSAFVDWLEKELAATPDMVET